MFGKNVTRGHDDDQRKDALDVVAIFPTIQGEGPLAGTPAVFVRLAHCNLKCTFCDTEFSQGVQRVNTRDLVMVIQEHSFSLTPGRVRPRGLVVITGGEPFRQPISDLCRWLIDGDYTVQIETAGALAPHPEDSVWVSGALRYEDEFRVVVSPKTPTLAPLFKDALLDVNMPNVVAKYIVREGDTSLANLLPTQGQGSRGPWWSEDLPVGKTYVQPMDEQNEEQNARNVAAAVKLCSDYGYRLSLQQHKIVGVP